MDNIKNYIISNTVSVAFQNIKIIISNSFVIFILYDIGFII